MDNSFNVCECIKSLANTTENPVITDICNASVKWFILETKIRVSLLLVEVTKNAQVAFDYTYLVEELK